jgi:hypothetical protein
MAKINFKVQYQYLIAISKYIGTQIREIFKISKIYPISVVKNPLNH